MTALTILFGILMFVTALFLILLVLVQRGRGGGLSGALGGMGGQSAFGTKAGDLFTRITIGVATFWILLCIVAILVLNRQVPAVPPGGGEGTEFTTIESKDGKTPSDPTGGMGATSPEPAEKSPDGADSGKATPSEKDPSK